MKAETTAGIAAPAGSPAGSRRAPGQGAAAAERLRVLHLFAPAPFGGLERVVASLAAGQVAVGHSVHVGAVVDAGSPQPPVVRDLREAGARVTVLRIPHRGYVREARAVRDLCTMVQPHVVHTHGYHSDVVHGWAARRLGLSTVSTVHGFTGGDWKNRLYERLQRWSHRRADAVVAVSRPMAEALATDGVPRERLHVVPNAWTGGVEFLEREEARRELGLADDVFAIGFVGRLSREKGPDIFVEALGSLEERAAAVVVGDGRMREELDRRADELGVAGSLHWPGVVNEAGRLMKAFDALVLSSRTEGTPVVLLEAMAAGTPVVATRVGGVPDVVTEAEALLVPPEDPLALAAAIGDIRDRPEAARARASRAQTRLKGTFGAASWLDAYDGVYRSCGAGSVKETVA